MTQEEKELLLKDLCARLPYNVKACESPDYPPITITSFDGDRFLDGDGWEHEVETFKSYLRPISSMTEEEKEELKEISRNYLDEWENAKTPIERLKLDAKVSYLRFVFYNSHHFDWNDLIHKGLAIEVTEENNPYKE